MRKLYFLFTFFLASGIGTTALAQCWKLVAAGSTHTVAVKSDGTLWAWGFNASGQLGDGTVAEKQVPTQISALPVWRSVSAGGNHTLAIRTDGTLWAWGDNQWGQVGDGTFGNTRRLPVIISTGNDWAAVSAGESFSLALKNDGTLWAWGDNFYGQLGHGHVTAFAPIQVGIAQDWKSISAGGNHSVALKMDNTLWTWGENLYGQLGDGTEINRSAPVNVGGTDWQSVEAGYNHTLALKSDGTLWTWGNNEDGELGDGTVVTRNSPSQVGSFVWKSLSGGKYNSLGIRNDGTLWAWGFIIGGVVFGEDAYRATPAQFEMTSPIESIILGDDHAFAFGSNGTLWTWGIGTWGKLGNDSWVDMNKPQVLFTAPPVGAGTQTFCQGAATISDIAVTGTDIRWYDTPTGGSELSSTTPLVDGSHYYASQTKYGCVSQTRLDVSAAIRTAPAAPAGQSTYTFCVGEKLTAVTLTGTAIKWYNATAGGTELSPALVSLSDKEHYYASQTIDGCESVQRFDVMAVANATPVPTTSQAMQTFCESSTIANLSVTGTNIKWYSDATSITELPTSMSLVSGMAYYASSTVNSLESCARLKVTATITNTPPPTGSARQAFCNGGQVAYLEANGGNISWYRTPSDGTPLYGWEALANGMYFASQKIGACESQERLQVEVVINNTSTPAPTGAATQVLCDQAPIGNIVVNGQNIKWYFTPTGNNPVSSQMGALETSYYASQTIDACESAGRLQVAVITNKTTLPEFPTATPWRSRIVSGDYNYSIAIMEDGTLWSWGNNETGVLGNGTRNSNHTPNMISSETDWVSIQAGSSHVLALKSNGALWAWGSNAAGQLGDGSINDQLVPTQIGTDTDWKAIAAGGSHSLALKNDGTLWACGWNHYGQTGIVTDRGWPLVGLEKVGTANDWETVAAGGSQSLAIKKDGTLWVWGKIGKGTDSGSTIQVKIPSDKPWHSIVAGHFHVLGIQSDGSLWAWGSNEYAQLGDGSNLYSQSSPSRVGTGHDWSQVSGGTAHSIAIKSDGSLWGWGQNAHSQVGVPMPPWQFEEPQQIGLDTDWKYVSAGYEHNLAIRKDGTLWAWGRNLYGQIGDGTKLTVLAPIPLQKDEVFVCGNGTLSGVVTNASQLNWYDAAEGGNHLDPATPIISGNRYYVSQTVNAQESCYRKAVTITSSETVPTAPTGNTLQTVCLGSRISDLEVEGINVKWYDAPTGGTLLTQSTILLNGSHYYASQRPGGCESTARLDVTVTLNSIDAPGVTSTQTFCDGATIEKLSANGTDIRWYETDGATTPLPSGTLLENSTQYFASQKIGACESSRNAVFVTVDPLPLAPTGNTAPIFCQASSVSDLEATGMNIIWYEIPAGGTPLEPSTALVHKKHYYATQEVNGCVSVQRLDVTATITILATPTAPLAQTFCQGATVMNLVSGGTGVKWYSAATGGDPLAANTVLQSKQYFSAQTSGPCESPRRAITVTITPVPSAPTGNPSQQFCKSGTIANLAASGTNIKWYDVSTGGIPLPASTVLVNGNHYYASQQPAGAACPSEQRLDVTATITTTPVPDAASTQVFCTGATIDNLSAAGSNKKWYDTPIGGSELVRETALIDNHQYFVSQSLGGCESERRTVTVTIDPAPVAPNGSASQAFCNTGTIANLVASGENVQWYDTSANNTPLESSTILIHGKVYYATQEINGCTSTDRLQVSITLISPEIPDAVTSQTFCAAATVSDLVVTGTDLVWYPTADEEASLPTSTTLEDGHRYYVAQKINGCESQRLAITANIHVIPTAPNGESIQVLEAAQLLSDLVVTGEDIKWYPSETDAINRSNMLSPTHRLVNNTSYYATQTVAGCESFDILTVTVSIIMAIESPETQPIYHPNPVKDYLYISMSKQINNVAVQNASGQLLLTKEVNSEQVAVDFSALSPGIYILRVNSGGGETSTIKVIKQ